jgi:uncharacterized protein (TIGR00290 family)
MVNRRKKKVILAWSGGKDSALALQSTSDRYEIVSLLTTVTEGYDRSSMHGVRRVLIERQAESMGYPLEIVFIPKECTNEDYNSRMRKVHGKLKRMGVTGVVFGDIHLQDVRKYREDNLAKAGMMGIFPLWGMESGKLTYRFVELGFRAVVVCVDLQKLDRSFVGKEYNSEFVAVLPSGIDPCGENGEFHTFVYNSPAFKKRIPFRRGRVVVRENQFCYCDLIPI